jgi:hypothetical protein
LHFTDLFFFAISSHVFAKRKKRDEEEEEKSFVPCLE